jgi:hypothetical protein
MKRRWSTDADCCSSVTIFREPTSRALFSPDLPPRKSVSSCGYI